MNLRDCRCMLLGKKACWTCCGKAKFAVTAGPLCKITNILVIQNVTTNRVTIEICDYLLAPSSKLFSCSTRRFFWCHFWRFFGATFSITLWVFSYCIVLSWMKYSITFSLIFYWYFRRSVWCFFILTTLPYFLFSFDYLTIIVVNNARIRCK